MKAPEKIYLNPLLMEDGESVVKRCTLERQRDSQIEYIRADAFIEKARKWLDDHMIDYMEFDEYSEMLCGFDEDKMLKEFVNNMKGE